ncbi:MAG: hypothetical protein ACOY94_09430 [Bacillota bacterium]
MAEVLGDWRWPVVFVLAWVVYFVTSDWRQLRRYWIGGALFAHRGLLFEGYFTNRGFWEHGHRVLPALPYSPKVEWLVALGPYFVLGVMIYQWLPWKRRHLMVAWALLWAVLGVVFDSTASAIGILRVSAQYEPWKHSFLVWLTWEGFLASKFYALGLDTDGDVKIDGFQWLVWVLPPAGLVALFGWTLFTLLTT